MADTVGKHRTCRACLLGILLSAAMGFAAAPGCSSGAPSNATPATEPANSAAAATAAPVKPASATATSDRTTNQAVASAQPAASGETANGGSSPDASAIRISMPGKFDDASVAGGGKSVIVRIPSKSVLAVVDLESAKLDGLIPTGDGPTLVAAGQDDVVVVKPADNRIERFNLATRKLEQSAHVDSQQPILAVAMGYASHGPILLGYGKDSQNPSPTVQMLDLQTLKPIAMQPPPLQLDVERKLTIRTSADGTVFGLWPNGPGVAALVALGDHVGVYYHGGKAEYVRPSASGDTIFTRLGNFDAELRAKESAHEGKGEPNWVPAIASPLFVGVLQHESRHGKKSAVKTHATIAIHAIDSPTPLLTLADFDEHLGHSHESFGIDGHFIYNPALNVLAVLHEPEPELVIHRLNLEERLKAAGKNYLVIVSSPPLAYSPGTRFTYAIKTLSSRSNPAFSLQSGPAGMTVSNDGQLSWMPDGTHHGPVDVAVSISDDAGENVLHQFRLLDRLQAVPAESSLAQDAPTKPSKPSRSSHHGGKHTNSKTASLAVISSPPRYYSIGHALTYVIRTASNSGGVTYTLQDGPKGMTVSQGGIVRWTPTARLENNVANVAILVSDASGTSVVHRFTLEDESPPRGNLAESSPGMHSTPPRSSPAAPSAPVRPPAQNYRSTQDFAVSVRGADGSPGVAKDGDRREKIFGRDVKPIINGGGPNSMLLIDSTHLVVLGSDGFSIEKEIKLPRAYDWVGRRDPRLVGLCSSPPSIDIISEVTGKVTRSEALPANTIYGLAMNPRHSVTYIAYRYGFNPPSCHFLALDELTGKVRQSPEFIASRLAIDPSGDFLYSGYNEVYQAGQQLELVPTGPDGGAAIGISPVYGEIDGLLKYSIADPLLPKIAAYHFKVGNNDGGLRISHDGRQLVNVGNRGTAQFRGWNPSAFRDLPKNYSLDYGGNNGNDFAFHPTLPIAAAIGENRVLLFNSDTNELLDGKIDGSALSGEGAIRRLWFARDGRSLVVLEAANDAAYLRDLPLKLTSEEQRRAESHQSAARSASEHSARAVKPKVPLTAFESLAGGLGEAMSSGQIARRFSDSVAIVESGDAAGTAFFVGSDGYAVTCAHCIDDPDHVELHYRVLGKGATAPGNATANATVLKLDKERDLALLKIQVHAPLTPIRIAAPDSIGNGDTVTLISNPGLGPTLLDHTVTSGVVSSVDRVFEDEHFLQTSAAVNPGSSGGPLFNDHGQVIGVIVLKGKIEGAGFAIPADNLISFLTHAAICTGDCGKLRREWLDATGSYVVDATLQERHKDEIKIRRIDNGQELSVPIEKLSPGDQKFLKLLPVSQ